MNVAIVGYGAEGEASCRYYLDRGDTVTICDQNEDLVLPPDVQGQLGSDYLHGLDGFDVIVRTAGMHPKLILEQNPTVGDKITTHIDEFLRVCPTKNVIGVTGTKGKGTTSTLITKMLTAAGKKVLLGGNIGVPPLGFLKELDAESWVVLELSSFQLIDVHHSPHIGVCLMVVPEHLNWHADMVEYVTAKSQLFARQTSEDIAIYYAPSEYSKRIASAGKGEKIPFYEAPGAYVENGVITIDGQQICKTSELSLLGEHNWQNACAAVTAVWQAGIRDVEAMRSTLTTFRGLEHRLELVRELDGVRYYDDSFGTTPETAIVAIHAFDKPKVIILGGSDKGANYDELAKVVASSNVRKVVLIGSEAPKIQAAIEAAGYHDFTNAITGAGKMPEIVKTASELAESGDIVLLSCACASFDMFNDYKDRGNQFKAEVNKLS